jgi:hypothetical protein
MASSSGLSIATAETDGGATRLRTPLLMDGKSLGGRTGLGTAITRWRLAIAGHFSKGLNMRVRKYSRGRVICWHRLESCRRKLIHRRWNMYQYAEYCIANNCDPWSAPLLMTWVSRYPYANGFVGRPTIPEEF